MNNLQTMENTVYRATALNTEALYEKVSELRRAEALADRNHVASPITDVLHSLERRVYCAEHNEDGNPWIECPKNSIDGILLLCTQSDYPSLMKVEHINKTGDWLDDDFGFDQPSQNDWYKLNKRYLSGFQLPSILGFFSIGSEHFQVIEDLGDWVTISRQQDLSEAPENVIQWER